MVRKKKSNRKKSRPFKPYKHNLHHTKKTAQWDSEAHRKKGYRAETQRAPKTLSKYTQVRGGTYYRKNGRNVPPHWMSVKSKQKRKK